MCRWIARYADARLLEQLDGLKQELAVANRTLAIQQAELQAMAGVIARDRERVKAELAGLAAAKKEISLIFTLRRRGSPFLKRPGRLPNVQASTGGA